MRSYLNIVLVLFFCCSALAQGTPPPVPDAQPETVEETGTPPASPQTGPLTDIKKLLKKEINHAVMGSNYPTLDKWKPLTAREKFQVFLTHTYSPRTFGSAGFDAVKDKIAGDDREYERGFMGLGQLYGVDLATNESDVFFERFLFPTLLKQDPRYFRNPELPFFKRVFYSVSRVVIARTDSGTETFNSSRLLGSAASQAISDLYVPGQRQGLPPVANRVAFDLGVDAGFNLLHEFWPDLRRKFLHR